MKGDSKKVADTVASTDDAAGGEEKPDYRKEFIDEYAKTLSIDTSFSTKKRTYTVLFRHLCSWDSALVVPAKYNYDTGSDFKTHNFHSELTVLEGVDTAFKKVITKDDFKSLLDPALESYGTLLFPTLRFRNDSIEVKYSISIPVTDVGIPVIIQFDTEGKSTIKQ
ncbi:hypothetical protein ACX0G7_26040 [Flavitalea antarctica]